MINTVHDFWRMIWEFKSKTIVQLCDLEENDIVSIVCVCVSVLVDSVSLSIVGGVLSILAH